MDFVGSDRLRPRSMRPCCVMTSYRCGVQTRRHQYLFALRFAHFSGTIGRGGMSRLTDNQSVAPRFESQRAHQIPKSTVADSLQLLEMIDGQNCRRSQLLRATVSSIRRILLVSQNQTRSRARPDDLKLARQKFNSLQFGTRSQARSG